MSPTKAFLLCCKKFSFRIINGVVLFLMTPGHEAMVGDGLHGLGTVACETECVASLLRAGIVVHRSSQATLLIVVPFRSIVGSRLSRECPTVSRSRV